MKKIATAVISLADQALAKVYLKSFQEEGSLITFLFHNLYCDKKEISLNVTDPQQGITVQYFRQFIEYYLYHDYTFISPDDILNGLNNNKKYVLITFDDGYFGNQHAVPILKEYKIPAVFFISANQVKYKKCFWWDVLYRERMKQRLPARNITREVMQLKARTHVEIEIYISNLFGEKAFEPICDVDRPFAPSELRGFSKEKFVFIGNHTSDHAILTNYSLEGIKAQILNAQSTIHDITGVAPLIVSYPNGNYSKKIIDISKEIGLRLGVTVDVKNNHLPIDFRNDDCMRLGRFTLWGNDNLTKQCESFRSGLQLKGIISGLLKKSY